jgi:hypothetical protein
MITSFSIQTIGLKIESNKDKNDTYSYDRYIIQFNDEPVSVFKNRFVNNIKNTFSQSSTGFINRMISQKVLMLSQVLFFLKILVIYLMV